MVANRIFLETQTSVYIDVKVSLSSHFGKKCHKWTQTYLYMSLRIGLQVGRCIRHISARTIVPSVIQLTRGIKSSSHNKGGVRNSYIHSKDLYSSTSLRIPIRGTDISQSHSR